MAKSKNQKASIKDIQGGRLGSISRKIEEHQEKIGAKCRTKKSFKTKKYFSVPDEIEILDSTEKHEGFIHKEEVYPGEEGGGNSYLWVLEPEDLVDFSIEQVEEIWSNRAQLCGSKEAAAEVLAIIEVVRGNSSNYQGWQAHINRDEIEELDIPFLDEDSEESYISSINRNALSLHQVLGLSDNELKNAWKNRPASFSSVEAACQALALLRQKAGVVNSSAWQALINHDEIKKLKDDLPYEGSASSFDNSKFDNKSLDSIALDEKKRRKSVSVVREGQQDFRQQVLNNYYGSCCISGSRIRTVLEAAHINPYTGHHSNRLDNGLCLRVDIHRLFDNFLLSIDPEKREVKISQKIKNDSEYRHLDGKQVMKGKVLASDYFLSQHYRTFCKRET